MWQQVGTVTGLRFFSMGYTFFASFSYFFLMLGVSSLKSSVIKSFKDLQLLQGSKYIQNLFPLDIVFQL